MSFESFFMMAVSAEPNLWHVPDQAVSLCRFASLASMADWQQAGFNRY